MKLVIISLWLNSTLDLLKGLSNLSCGWDEQTEALYGDIDCNTHSSKAQVTLSHDGLKSFVQGLQDNDTVETVN